MTRCVQCQNMIIQKLSLLVMKKLLLVFFVCIPFIYIFFRHNSEGYKTYRAKKAVEELVEKGTYTAEQLYDMAEECKIYGDKYKSFYLLQYAASQGDANAEFEVGRLYHLKGVQHQAIKWMTRAAERGNPKHQYELGRYYDALFERKDEDEDFMRKMAAIYYLEAAEQGYANAQVSIGQCYRLGSGVEKDLKKAEMWYLRAKQQGENTFEVDEGLAWLYIKTNRWELAIPLFQKLAAGGHIYARRLLRDLGYDVPQVSSTNSEKE